MPERNIKIGFISYFNPKDRKSASGTPYKVYEQLSKIGEATWIPIKKKKIWSIIKYPFYIYNLLNKKHAIDWEHTAISNLFKYKSFKESDFREYDVLIAYFCSSVITKKFSRPLIYLSDTTFPGMVNYYEVYSNIPKFNIKEGYRLEKRALNNANLIVLSSDWAKNTAITKLNIDDEKINVVEFGANIDNSDIPTTKRDFSNNQINLLFLGVKWDRKGGDIAVETVKWLNENGVNSILHIIGIKDLKAEITSLPYIKSYGFLNKNAQEDYQKLNSILKESHLMLLPTKAECSAIAFAEACAYGLPVFTHDTGGIGNYIINDFNGYRLPLGSSGEDFGKLIKKSLLDNKLDNYSQNARRFYEERLNWDTWGNKITDLIYKTLIKDGRK